MGLDQLLELLALDGLHLASDRVVEIVDRCPLAEQLGGLAVIVGGVDGWIGLGIGSDEPAELRPDGLRICRAEVLGEGFGGTRVLRSFGDREQVAGDEVHVAEGGVRCRHLEEGVVLFRIEVLATVGGRGQVDECALVLEDRLLLAGPFAVGIGEADVEGVGREVALDEVAEGLEGLDHVRVVPLHGSVDQPVELVCPRDLGQKCVAPLGRHPDVFGTYRERCVLPT